MLKHKIIAFFMFSCLLLSCSSTFAYYQGEGKDMGYWCTDCNKQHAAGETCPYQGSGSGFGSSDDDDGVVRVDPSVEEHNKAKTLNNNGVIYFRNGDYEKALEQFKQALDKWPENEVYRKNLKATEERIESKKNEEEQKKKEAEERKIEIAQAGERGRQKGLDEDLFREHKMPNFPIFGVDLSDLRSQTVNINIVKGIDISGVKVIGAENTPEFRNELFRDYLRAYHGRTREHNTDYINNISIIPPRSTKEPPSPYKNISNLWPGDVILIAPDGPLSNIINKTDRWASDSSNSPASHTASYLGEKNGKRWYLNNTPETGPVIMEEKDFLEKYAKRKMDVATLVGQPISKQQGDEFFKAAEELIKIGGYGIKALPAANGNDNMVCSEASRWLLLRVGKRVPETRDELKKKFVKFSPSDFYDNQQYFVVHTLGMPK